MFKSPRLAGDEEGGFSFAYDGVCLWKWSMVQVRVFPILGAGHRGLERYATLGELINLHASCCGDGGGDFVVVGTGSGIGGPGSTR
jgi:hypothetical protein